MNFEQFKKAAELESKASIEKFNLEARRPFDEKVRLGNVAGPLVCTSCTKDKAEFKEGDFPFDWGKLKADKDLHPLLSDEVLTQKESGGKSKAFGSLAVSSSSKKLIRKKYFGGPDYKLQESGVYGFEATFFDSDSQAIKVLNVYDENEEWPPSSVVHESASSQSAKDACLNDTLPIVTIKGPPGTGKTELLATVALELAAQGKKVGLLTVAHDAVNEALERMAKKQGEEAEWPNITIQKHGDIKKDDQGNNITIEGVTMKKINLSNLPDIWGAVIASGIHMYQKENWHIILEFKFGTCDVLLIDEAGQVPVYVAAALSRIAPRMIFFGDEDQLPHIAQAQHPPKSEGGLSAMAYLNANSTRATALALETSYRMNETICRLIQRHFYPSINLTSAPNNKDTHLLEKGQHFPALVKDNFKHTHPCLSRSAEEAERVVKWVTRLLQMEVFFSGSKEKRIITTADIAILSPFRAHVREIQSALNKAGISDVDQIRIGSVDKMQGQGAPIVIYSLASSSTDYIEGQLEWLLSANRWNVAISRAQACAIVVGDLDAHLNATPKVLKAIATQNKIKKLMDDNDWKSPSIK